MKYISLLRGINVSGQKKIKMADLKSLYSELGLTEITTYIQSGNVVFNVAGQIANELPAVIATRIEAVYGFKVPVVVRTNAELARVIAGCPFGEIDVSNNGAKYAVAFLSAAPADGLLAELSDLVKPPEELVAHGREIYLHCPHGFGRTKLTNTLLEKKLAVTATSRNWRTVLKLHELSTS